MKFCSNFLRSLCMNPFANLCNRSAEYFDIYSTNNNGSISMEVIDIQEGLPAKINTVDETKFTPFCSVLMKEIKIQMDENTFFDQPDSLTEIFKEIYEEKHSDTNDSYVPWCDLVSEAYSRLTLSKKEESWILMTDTILPFYPIICDEISKKEIKAQLETENSINYSSYLEEMVVKTFLSSLVKVSSETEWKNLLYSLQISLKPFETKMRFHFAFLLNYPLEYLKTFEADSFVYEMESNGENILMNFLKEFGSKLYENVLSNSVEDAEILIGSILPNVYDELPEELSYDEIITQYSASQIVKITENDLNLFVKRIKGIFSAAENRRTNQVSDFSSTQRYFMELVSLQIKESKKLNFVAQFALKHFRFIEGLSVYNINVIYWHGFIVSLILRFAQLYPEEAEIMHVSRSLIGDTVKELLNSEIANETTELFIKHLEVFAEYNLIEAFQLLLQQTDINITSSLVAPALLKAVAAGNYTLTRIILKHFKFIDEQNYGIALFTAYSDKNYRIFRILVEKCDRIPSANVLDTAKLCIIEGNMEDLIFIFSFGIVVPLRIIRNIVAILIRIGQIDVVRFFYEHETLWVPQFDDYVLGLEVAIESDRKEIFDYFEQAFNDAGCEYDYSRALAITSKNGSIHLIKHILQKQTYTEDEYRSAMQVAAKAGHDYVLLMTLKFWPNFEIARCEEALTLAVKNGRSKTVSCLIGNFPFTIEIIQNSCFLAVSLEDHKTLHSILQHRCNEINETDLDKLMDTAIKLSNAELARVIMKYGQMRLDPDIWNLANDLIYES